MDELIEEIVNIVSTEADEWIRKYDLKRIIENYTEREINKRVDEHIEEEKQEAWSNGYSQGKREAIECIRDNFDDILVNI